MDHWFYIEDRARKGPVDRDTLATLITMGKLPGDTLVWTEDLADWTPAQSVKGLVPAALSSPPVSRASPSSSPPVPTVRPAPSSPPLISAPPIPAPTEAKPSGFVAAGPQVRPWIRFWARITDYGLFGSFLATLLLLIAPDLAAEMLDQNYVFIDVFFVVVVFLWVFIEAALLAVLGTTPAKALLNIRVRHSDGSLLSYGEGLRRAFGVWFHGVGIGILLAELLFMAFSYFRLKKSGTTNWDAGKPWEVQHRPVGWIRSIALILILLVGILLSAPLPEA